MKRKLFALAVILILLAAIAGGTWAYYVSSRPTHNVITTSSVGIQVEEWQKKDGVLEPYPKTPVDVMPGRSVSKIVTIRNEKAESFIRACLEVTLTDRSGKKRLLSPEETENLLHLQVNTDSWKQMHGDEKWWYYHAPVEEDGVTDAFLTGVTFDGPGMTNAYQNSTIEIHVAGQAVQTANNSATALTAFGWPGT